MNVPVTRLWVSLICTISLMSLSCKKFLSTYSQNSSFIESADDLDELLVGNAYYYKVASFTPNMLYAMDDDAELGKPATKVRIPNQETGFHFWQSQPRIDSDGKLTATDDYYNDLYSRIARSNTILHNIPLLREKGEAAQTLNRIHGEACFLRACYYFMLVNIYGKPYQPAVAGFGVPLKTDPAIKDQFIARSSTQQLYNQIVSDLLEAEKQLAGANQTTTIRANQAAAQALLSRVYLFMENYEKALLYADKLINNNQYQLKDLNQHTQGDDFLKRNSPEVIFSMSTTNMHAVTNLSTDAPSVFFYKASEELALLYLPEDLRRKVFFSQDSKGNLRMAKKRKTLTNSVDDASDMFLLRLSEQYLNKAEALAGLDRFEEARNSLQEFRKTRFKPGEVPALHSEGAALMNTIRDERRLELCFETHRWFDLRRYAVNAKYPFEKTIRHRAYTFTGNGYDEDGYYELGTWSQDPAAYIVPIANDEIEFNNGLLFNETRPDRPLKR
ncbi:RagB/SusD family nutrient uptake outer membrane protein [Pseudobacter ginsenosidimutans]|uniref:SusD-like starch-binding protein associating with outer membrane n=1 Tax=Pseudobacter ginsenosidimutans TaxID=661488 RepID=A0A4Q7MYL0_9BACT|nr:RagB/SusD family nutrient uptake outer membrane protein [Pseudobacter ginsenosidimutans]RZS74317.1 SusD-like starch-binding protein associating with outer membrane [Pseudobacter ginsenosidimutans]